MTEYINKQALLAEYDCVHVGPPGGARKLIEEAPAANVAPVVHGRWEESVEIQTDTSTLYDYTCSVCSIVTTRESLYCPNCGARMDGE